MLCNENRRTFIIVINACSRAFGILKAHIDCNYLHGLCVVIFLI